MQKLAAGSIGAVELLVVALALLGLVVARLVSPLLELVGTMCKGAGFGVLACAIQLPEFTDFRLKLHFEALLRLCRVLLSGWVSRNLVCSG